MPVPEIRSDGSIKPGKYFLDIHETLDVNKPVSAAGVEFIKAARKSSELRPAVKLTSGGELSGLSIKYAGSYQVGAIEAEGEQMVLDSVNVTGGYAGIWVKRAKGMKIVNCHVSSCSHNLYLGPHSGDPKSERVEDVLIEGGSYNDAIVDDGIKTLRQCENIEIIGVQCLRNAKDGIDLFAGGNSIRIANCVLSGNRAQGVDIKTDAQNYPPDEWGYISNIAITGSQIDFNGKNGVKVWRVRHWPFDHTQPEGVIIEDWRLNHNTYAGILSKADYMIMNGCETNSNGKYGIYCLGTVYVPSKGADPEILSCRSGQIRSCSATSNGAGGIVLSSTDEFLVEGCAVDSGGNASFGFSYANSSVKHDNSNQIVNFAQGKGLVWNNSKRL